MQVVIPTPKTINEYKTTIQYKCLEKIQNSTKNFNIEIIADNKTGLSEVYNNAIIRYKDTDILLFIHDDVEIHDLFLYEKLKQAHKRYEIVGLAGAISQNYIKTEYALWHKCMDKNSDGRGFVAHSFPKTHNTNAFLNSAYFGPTPSLVKVIDGLFISVCMIKVKQKLNDKPLFDNDFTFHHYDLAMCEHANVYGIDIGVYPIFVIHHGLGEYNTKEWYNSNELFLKKNRFYRSSNEKENK